MAKQSKAPKETKPAEGTDKDQASPTPAPQWQKGTPTANSITASLGQRFGKSVEKVVAAFPYEHRLELIEHLDSMLDFMEQYANSTDPKEQRAIFKLYYEQELSLLRKYGRLLKDYEQQKFNFYFDVDEAIMDFEIVPTETYFEILEELKEERLSASGMSAFLQTAKRYTSRLRRDYLINKEPEVTIVSQTGSTEPVGQETEPERTDKEAYRSRAVLALYFLLKARGIEGRRSHNVSAVSKFVHMLFGIVYVPKDEIYKMLLKMPNYKTDQTVLDDLKYIRPYFVDLDMADVLKLIDEEIARASKGRRQPNRGE